jgi:O-antigen/teichoic acid export membrane protein
VPADPPPDAAAAETGSSAPALGGLVRRGVAWTVFSQVSVQALALLTSVVVAHLLSPRQVGLASEAAVFVSLVLVVTDFGLGAVVIQRASTSEVELSTLFWSVVGLGVAMTAIGVGLAWPIAALYHQPEVRGLFAVMSLTFLATGPGIIPGALLVRELQFRRLELRNVAATVAGCVVAIVLAALGAGPWAIVAQTVSMASVSTLLLWRTSTWRPGMTFSRGFLREVRGFSSQVMGSKTVGWASANVDNLLVGKFRGPSPLGAYSLAFAVALTPVNRLAGPMVNVFFPAFSKLRDREPIADMWLRAERVLAFVAVPAMLGLVIVAPDLVRVVFGYRWRHAAPVMQLLAVVALTQTLTALNDGIFQALGETRTQFRFRAVLSVVTLAAFAGGLPWGITGASAGYLIASLVLQPVYVWLTVRLLRVPARRWASSVGGVFAAGGAMIVVLYLLRRALLDAHLPAAARLVVLVLAGALVYGGLIAWRGEAIKRELRLMLARRRAGAVNA